MSEETSCSRRRALQTLGSVVLTAGLAGCGQSSSDPSEPPVNATGSPTSTLTGTPTDAATQTETATETNTETATETGTHSHENHTHTHQTPPDGTQQQFIGNPEGFHSKLSQQAATGANEVLVGFRLEDSSLPFTTEVYQSPADAKVHATKTYDTADLSQVPLVPDPPKSLETMSTKREDVHYATTEIGEPLKVTLVARQDSRPTFDWSAWERTGHPYGGHRTEDPYLKIDCYCGGETYTAPRGGTWARVIQITPTDRVASGTTVALNWTSSKA